MPRLTKLQPATSGRRTYMAITFTPAEKSELAKAITTVT